MPKGTNEVLFSYSMFDLILSYTSYFLFLKRKKCLTFGLHYIAFLFEIRHHTSDKMQVLLVGPLPTAYVIHHLRSCLEQMFESCVVTPSCLNLFIM